MDILKKKLSQDLYHECSIYKDQLGITDSTFDEWIQHRINECVKSVNLSMYDHQINDNLCMARVWKGNSGQQCTHTKKEGDYCGKHCRMLREEGVLRFGDIRTEKPKYDLIKQKNGLLEELPWVHSDPIQQLQTVLDNHSLKVIYSVPHLIVS